jgi:hypothetical protein
VRRSRRLGCLPAVACLRLEAEVPMFL